MARGFGVLADGCARAGGQKSARQPARVSGGVCTVGGAVVRPAVRKSLLGAFRHFAARCAERFGLSQDDALAVWTGAVQAFRAEDFDTLRPVMRIRPAGRRVFAWRLDDGRCVFIVFDCALALPVTVLCEGMEMTRLDGGFKVLGVPRDWS